MKYLVTLLSFMLSSMGFTYGQQCECPKSTKTKKHSKPKKKHMDTIYPTDGL